VASYEISDGVDTWDEDGDSPTEAASAVAERYDCGREYKGTDPAVALEIFLLDDDGERTGECVHALIYPERSPDDRVEIYTLNGPIETEWIPVWQGQR
jgi:hypothetical protein